MKNKIAGWKHVFRFTLEQTLKSRAFVISFILFIALAIVSMPIMSAITGNTTQESSYDVEKLYIYDQTGVMTQEQARTAMQKLADAGWQVAIELCEAGEYNTAAYEEKLAVLDQKEPNAVVMAVTDENDMIQIRFERSGNGKVDSSEIEQFGTVMTESYQSGFFSALGITAQQQEMVTGQTVTSSFHVDENNEIIVKEDTSISDMEYWFLYGILFVILMVCTMTGSQVATAIVTEKSSKVVEYLLTSVRPLAIIVGKVLAMLCAVLTEVICLLIALAVSNYVSTTYFTGGESILEKYLSPELLSSLNLGNVIMCLVMIALGLIFYATLAGLAGATVSRMEEAGEGLMLFTMTAMIGCYIGIAAAGTLLGAGENAFVTFALIFPLSSPFILPGAILIGKAELWLVAAAVVLLVTAIVLLFLFVARVYETLIVYNGNRIGLKQLIKMK